MSTGDPVRRTFTKDERRENELMALASEYCDAFAIRYAKHWCCTEDDPWIVFDGESYEADARWKIGATFLETLTRWCLDPANVPSDALPEWLT